MDDVNKSNKQCGYDLLDLDNLYDELLDSVDLCVQIKSD